MLILTRRLSEKIRIGNDIEVAILGINGMQVRIGVEAPNQISVHREEIYKKIQEKAQKEKMSEKCLEEAEA